MLSRLCQHEWAAINKKTSHHLIVKYIVFMSTICRRQKMRHDCDGPVQLALMQLRTRFD